MSSTAQAYHVHHNDLSKSHLSPTFTSNLVLTDIPIPTPGPNSVLVRIRAVSLNYRDLLTISDSPLYPIPSPVGLVPCADGSGEILSVGSGSKWSGKIGEHVILVTNRDWVDGDIEGLQMGNTLGAGDCNGTLTQYIVVEDEWLIKAPGNLSFEESAALPAAGGTAMNVLTSIQVKEGTTVLTQGTGGVSCFVIQFATAMGATVIATSSTDAKLEEAKKLGAAELINYNNHPKWESEVLRLTKGRGVDLVSDVGGSSTVEQSIVSLRQGGTACLIGFLTPPKDTDIVFLLIKEARILKGILGNSKKMLEQVVELVEKKDLHPPVGAVYEWEDAKKAFERLRSQDFIGKVVIKA